MPAALSSQALAPKPTTSSATASTSSPASISRMLVWKTRNGTWYQWRSVMPLAYNGRTGVGAGSRYRCSVIPSAARDLGRAGDHQRGWQPPRLRFLVAPPLGTTCGRSALQSRRSDAAHEQPLRGEERDQ